MVDRFYEQGSFICLDGPAKKSGLDCSNMKVCFTATSFKFLKSLLEQISELESCYWVKMSKKDRDGMYLARCFFTTSEVAGQIWAQYKSHPQLMANLQDANFVSKFRSSSK